MTLDDLQSALRREVYVAEHLSDVVKSLIVKIIFEYFSVPRTQKSKYNFRNNVASFG